MQPSRPSTRNSKPSNSRAVCPSTLPTNNRTIDQRHDFGPRTGRRGFRCNGRHRPRSRIPRTGPRQAESPPPSSKSYLTYRISIPPSPLKRTVNEPVLQTLMRNSNPSIPSSAPKTQSVPKALSPSKNSGTKWKSTIKKNNLLKPA